jgi:outer membrane murein-binding lipoprotein Lpp
MEKIVPFTIASLALLLVAGCNNKASMENQSTNAPAERQPSAMNTNSSSGAEMTNAIPSTGMDTNNPATTNSMNTTTNMTPQ